MRKIKFRAKTDVNIEEVEHIKIEHDGNWVFGAYLDGFIVDGVVEATDEYIALEYWCPIDIDTVGQYTGLKDKNGVEIYEGDIIEIVFYSYQQPECSALFEIKYEGMGFIYDYIKGNTLDFSYTEEWIVIGNIYEDPELLEGAE